MKARAKNLSNWEWVSGGHYQHNGFTVICLEEDDEFGESKYFADPKTLCWSADHRDINGKEIFTDDIVAGRDNKDSVFIGIIKLGEYSTGHDSYHYGFYIDWKMLGPIHRPLMNWISSRSLKLEVIGNIYDNPDLVEKFDLLTTSSLTRNIIKEDK